MPLSKVVILGTGGTIAGLAPAVGNAAIYSAAQLSVAEVLQRADVDDKDNIVTEQICQIDSKDMDLPTVQTIVSRCVAYCRDDAVVGIVITHGTDTLEETAFLLASVLQPSKPVVITGAMRPSNVCEADGVSNLIDAVTVARDASARGVWVVFAGKIHHADVVRKVHPYALDAFDSSWSQPAGWVKSHRVCWQSESGLVDSYSVADCSVRGDENACAASKRAFESLLGSFQREDVLRAFLNYPSELTWPWVEILNSGLGVTAAGVAAMVQGGVRGLVMVGTGNGTMQTTLYNAVIDAQSLGVEILVTTRCTQGIMVATIENPQLPVAYGMTAAQARMCLVIRLVVNATSKRLHFDPQNTL